VVKGERGPRRLGRFRRLKNSRNLLSSEGMRGKEREEITGCGEFIQNRRIRRGRKF